MQKGHGVGSVLSSIFRNLLPVVKRVGTAIAKSPITKRVGKAAAKAALGGGIEIVSDALRGQSSKSGVKQTLKRAGRTIADSLIAPKRAKTKPKPKKAKKLARKNNKKRGRERLRDIFDR
jgi:hypothetical protein